MSTKQQRAEWRKEQGVGMVSALGEYTPDEFWEVLDELESVEQQRDELAAALREIVDYIAVNEMAVAPAYPMAPHKMKDIARAALAKLDTDSTKGSKR